MNQRGSGKLHHLMLLSVFSAISVAAVSAQTPMPRTPPPAPLPETPRARKPGGPTRTPQVSIDAHSGAPQVVTILHRLNGLKMFRLLRRSGAEIGAITKLDEAFSITEDVHTSVIAGLAMDDGQTIAAWLPEADAEMGPALAPAPPAAPLAPDSPALASVAAAKTPVVHGTENLFGDTGTIFDRPDVTVIGRDGRRLTARYIGLDGVTGLSVLKLGEQGILSALTEKDQVVKIGQRLRLFGPEPVAQAEARAAGTIYVRMGETEGRVVSVSHSPSGMLARIRIKSVKLSPANIGGIAINDEGETVGIVDAVEGNEASLLTNALVRGAAQRVTERQSSVPRPWLGIRGEPIGTLAFEQILRGGWQAERARSLVEEHRGILLTSVAPGSPAAGASLRPGDVILRVNDGDVKNADEFSWSLEEAGAGTSVHFTVARPGKASNEAVELKLSEAPVAFFGWTEEPGSTEVKVEQIIRGAPPGAIFGEASTLPPGAKRRIKGSMSAALMSQGIETIALTPRVALRFGATGGLLVVYVEPSMAAFKAGLRSGDVIEAIDGRKVSLHPRGLASAPGGSYSLDVVRKKQKLMVKILDQKN